MSLVAVFAKPQKCKDASSLHTSFSEDEPGRWSAHGCGIRPAGKRSPQIDRCRRSALRISFVSRGVPFDAWPGPGTVRGDLSGVAAGLGVRALGRRSLTQFSINAFIRPLPLRVHPMELGTSLGTSPAKHYAEPCYDTQGNARKANYLTFLE
jgi:hypothetical protein